MFLRTEPSVGVAFLFLSTFSKSKRSLLLFTLGPLTLSFPSSSSTSPSSLPLVFNLREIPTISVVSRVSSTVFVPVRRCCFDFVRLKSNPCSNLLFKSICPSSPILFIFFSVAANFSSILSLLLSILRSISSFLAAILTLQSRPITLLFSSNVLLPKSFLTLSFFLNVSSSLAFKSPVVLLTGLRRSFNAFRVASLFLNVSSSRAFKSPVVLLPIIFFSLDFSNALLLLSMSR
uniref:Uncharacterized protein n=1 Tax=Cacopsylla melanoneura TaxID=428564 RepID=A0A8D8SNR1_9HEMI